MVRILHQQEEQEPPPVHLQLVLKHKNINNMSLAPALCHKRLVLIE
jgi:hypothetical protein